MLWFTAHTKNAELIWRLFLLVEFHCLIAVHRSLQFWDIFIPYIPARILLQIFFFYPWDQKGNPQASYPRWDGVLLTRVNIITFQKRAMNFYTGFWWSIPYSKYDTVLRFRNQTKSFVKDSNLRPAAFVIKMGPKSEKCVNLCPNYISMGAEVHTLFVTLRGVALLTFKPTKLPKLFRERHPPHR